MLQARVLTVHEACPAQSARGSCRGAQDNTTLRLGEVAESDEAGARHGTMKRSIALIVARVAELHYHAPSRSPAPGQIVQVRVNMRSTWRDEAG